MYMSFAVLLQMCTVCCLYGPVNDFDGEQIHFEGHLKQWSLKSWFFWVQNGNSRSFKKSLNFQPSAENLCACTIGYSDYDVF